MRPETPVFVGDTTAAKNYERTLEKVVVVANQPPSIRFSSNPKEFFPRGNSERYAKFFSDMFYKCNDTNPLPSALENYIATRKKLLGDDLKGSGTPCILFTTIKIDSQEYCLVSVSGIQSFLQREVSAIADKNIQEICENIRRFWNVMNAFFMQLSFDEKIKDSVRYVFLGGRSQNYDILLNAVLAALNADKPDSHGQHRACAEKAAFNFLQKLISEHGQSVSVTGSQAYSLSPKSLKEIPPCSVCKLNIPGVKALLGAAEILSPTREEDAKAAEAGTSTPRERTGSAVVKPSPLKTSPQPNLRLFRERPLNCDAAQQLQPTAQPRL